jgi:hypothetical protein
MIELEGLTDVYRATGGAPIRLPFSVSSAPCPTYAPFDTPFHRRAGAAAAQPHRWAGFVRLRVPDHPPPPVRKLLW